MYSTMFIFRKHEFEKHGRCATEDPAIKNQHGYFKFGIDLMKKLNLLETLMKNNITPHDSKQYETTNLQSVLKKEFGYNGSLKCTEIRKKPNVRRLEEKGVGRLEESAPPRELDGFTIHAMWPKTARHKDPKCKSKEQFDIAQLRIFVIYELCTTSSHNEMGRQTIVPTHEVYNTLMLIDTFRAELDFDHCEILA
ncbi:hypothetical protein MS3_00010005 [Schistosoma haematobium]|uniref:Uncharacterized protein n=1 Tax=Schistosoma haematobium TaxID=6185 RepID=A0A922LTD3_SCHHA|nr:hypothetical protein MS3_00010005 [Schistosoma haematobium]KAH9593616.1 hypothetical protein MS3_00010005 [Schistosoma haematobium]